MNAHAHSFALTSPSTTDVDDYLTLEDAAARYDRAEQRGEAALAAWAVTYGRQLIAALRGRPEPDGEPEEADTFPDDEQQAALDRIETTVAAMRAEVEAMATEADSRAARSMRLLSHLKDVGLATDVLNSEAE